MCQEAHVPEHDVARLEGGDVVEEEEHFAPLSAGPIDVGLDPKAVGHQRAEAAQRGQEAHLADLLTQAEIELGAMEKRGAVLVIQADLDGDADSAEQQEHGGDSGKANPGASS